MRAVLLGLLAETFIHPGTGRSTGFVDHPVAREAVTDYPVIVGSSVKGALRDVLRSRGEEGVEGKLFGGRDRAGEWLISDARLLLLPVRSLTGSFCWLTCPHLLERYWRDNNRIGRQVSFVIPQVNRTQALASSKGPLFLEEREFTVGGAIEQAIVKEIGELIPHEVTRSRLAERLVVISDEDFAWFARFGLPVQARNALNEATKTSFRLWYEESIPPEALFYALVVGRTSAPAEVLAKVFSQEKRYLQLGGHETIGQGWFSVRLLTVE